MTLCTLHTTHTHIHTHTDTERNAEFVDCDFLKGASICFFFFKVESEDKFERIGGSSIGGGTFWGLGALLTKTKVVNFVSFY